MHRFAFVLFSVLSLLLLNGCATPGVNQKVTVKGYGAAGAADGGLQADYEFVSGMQDGESMVIIFDASGSMLYPLSQGGSPRYKQAQKALSEFIEARGKSGNIAMVVYGSRQTSGIYNGAITNEARARKSCLEDIELTVPIGPFDPANFRAEMDRLQRSDSYRGDTPIGGAIAMATDYLVKNAPTTRKSILLITDGDEECWRSDGKGVAGAISPEAAVKDAHNKGIEIRLVPFGVGIDKDGKKVANAREILERVKKFAPDGYFEANTGDELGSAMKRAEINRTELAMRDASGREVARFRMGDTFPVTLPPVSTEEELNKTVTKAAKSLEAAAKGSQVAEDQNAGKVKYEIVGRTAQSVKVPVGLPPPC